ncbi:MAG: DUF6435 family protein [Saprospiraceae bacterium]
MFGLFKKKDPAAKLEKEYEDLLARSTEVQRSGDLRAYAAMIEESEKLWARIEAIRGKK